MSSFLFIPILSLVLIFCVSGPGLAQAAGELEVFVDQNLFRLLDTIDGTLTPLCKGIPNKDLEDVTGWLKEKKLDWKSSFELLDIETKKSLIILIAKKRGLEFSEAQENRMIPGLIVKNTLELRGERKAFSVSGIPLVRGSSVHLSNLFEKYVEFGNPESSSENLKVIELHLRNSKIPSGSDLYHSALVLNRYLGLQIASVHIHLLKRYPNRLKSNVSGQDVKLYEFIPEISPVSQKFVDRIIFLEWVRRVNLFLEVKAILSDVEVPYVLDSETGVVYFSSFSQASMAYLWAWVVANRPSASEGKIGSGFFSLYAPGKYDDKRLFGFEVRGLPKVYATAEVEKTMNMLDYFQQVQIDFSSDSEPRTQETLKVLI